MNKSRFVSLATLLLLVASIPVRAQSKETTAEVFRVTVNYNYTLDRMIEEGKYDWKSPNITAKNFPVEGKGRVKVAIELVHFNRVTESDEVLRELDKMGLRPATLPELLAFGVSYPEKQRELPIVALGSVWRRGDGRRGVACLYGSAGDRDLRLNWLESRWLSLCRFLAVRK